MFRADSRIRVIGHRGAAGVAPENTVAAIERGVSSGADGIEVDVHLSADDRLVTIHDPTLERTTNGAGPVEARTLADLRRLDAGHHFTPDRGGSFPFRGVGVRIPTLDEAVEAAIDLPMILEVKSERAGRALADWLRRRRTAAGDTGRFVVGGFERRMVEPAAGAADHQCATRRDLVPFVVATKLGLPARLRPEVDAVMVPIRKGPVRLVTRRFVRRSHGLGLGVFVWTVNRPDVMRRLFDLGVDGLISDVPARVRRILDEREAWQLPEPNGDRRT